MIGTRRYRAKADGYVAAGHDEVAVREIDRRRRVDDEHETKSDQRVRGTKREAVDDEL